MVRHTSDIKPQESGGYEMTDAEAMSVSNRYVDGDDGYWPEFAKLEKLGLKLEKDKQAALLELDRKIHEIFGGKK